MSLKARRVEFSPSNNRINSIMNMKNMYKKCKNIINL